MTTTGYEDFCTVALILILSYSPLTCRISSIFTLTAIQNWEITVVASCIISVVACGCKSLCIPYHFESCTKYNKQKFSNVFLMQKCVLIQISLASVAMGN